MNQWWSASTSERLIAPSQHSTIADIRSRCPIAMATCSRRPPCCCSTTAVRVVGQAALDVAQEQPDRVATLVKRRMGLESYGRLVAGREFRPETLSAIILRKLVQDAESRLGPISRAVITVPAYFDDTRRKATQDAGRIAGLEVLDILDEPTAATLAYSFQRGNAIPSPQATLTDGPQTILVYDLGGGTFDVHGVQLLPKRFQVLAIEGDVRLGGKDWDDRIVNHVADAFQGRFGNDPRTDPQSLAVLQAAAERAKAHAEQVGTDQRDRQSRGPQARRAAFAQGIRSADARSPDADKIDDPTSAQAGGVDLGTN